MTFEWDCLKATSNLRKHDVAFYEAASVFADPLSVTYHDPDHSVPEDRFVTMGVSHAGRALVIAHTDRGDKIRIISARRATKR